MLKRRPHKDAKDTSYNVIESNGVVVRRAWTLAPHKGLCIAWNGAKDGSLVLLHLASGKCPLSKVQFPMAKGAGSMAIDIEAHPLTLEAMRRVMLEVAELVDWTLDESAEHRGALKRVDEIAAKHILPLLPLPAPAAETATEGRFLLRIK